MNLNEFIEEVEKRLQNEKEDIIRKLYGINGIEQRLSILGDFHQLHKRIIRDIAKEKDLDLNQRLKLEENPMIIDSSLSLENIVFTKTSGMFARLGQEILEEIKRIN
ncbi:hypothetical protein [Chryseobacterium profundimaris]|uniref:Uncharacterized protein n=1 Tax=Chryseobacterium profundimaris TaxID=1387275 RepID=A0ABY1NUY5_9FLAO|nr:hypothetical protein [Chryseobacterium profundimaris]SMP19013.1 hypothetical protein SAMN06264346_10526 [Chryseobacterium profundimaris]